MERCCRHPRCSFLPSALIKDVTSSYPAAVKEILQQILCASVLVWASRAQPGLLSVMNDRGPNASSLIRAAYIDCTYSGRAYCLLQSWGFSTGARLQAVGAGPQRRLCVH